MKYTRIRCDICGRDVCESYSSMSTRHYTVKARWYDKRLDVCEWCLKNIATNIANKKSREEIYASNEYDRLSNSYKSISLDAMQAFCDGVDFALKYMEE